MTAREVAAVVQGQEVVEGAGVRVRRTLGTRTLESLDPFLLLDEFRSDSPEDYMAGFPDHPHRGFETVTYMLAGFMRHRDHMGNQGDLGPGAVQWMTAGRGVIHSEMPRQHEGLLWGFQLWVNLPAARKMDPPRYQDIPPERVPEIDLAGGGRARVIAGTSGGVAGAAQGVATAPLYLDIALPAGAALEHPVPPGHAAFLYPFQGAVRASGPERPTVVPRGALGVLGDGDHLRASAGDSPCRFLLVAARPLREPVARGGPFVMNTAAEIRQAYADYRAGRLQG